MSKPEGLRERKKRKMRESIANAAARLFTRRGFETVTVAEVAREAEVSEQTVFNYFPTKEDLVFDRDLEIEEGLVRLVRELKPGGKPLAAIREYTLLFLDQLGEVPPENHGFLHLVSESPALQAHGREMRARHTASLAKALAERMQRPDSDTEVWTVAEILMVTQSSFMRSLVQHMLGGKDKKRALAAVRAEMDRVFELLGEGFSKYRVP
ncbi:TetR/AcrR family transcriptional regulator [Pendulispora albinea]|uniref:TetR/AcrR family transcriptional regulator n=1 Tax=Pendulispora albinea TaxID=2741071 RepID=A0ABZ2M6J9_9BACT